VKQIETAGSTRERPVLGREAIEAQAPDFRPAGAKKAPRPLCHAGEAGLRRSFLDTYRAFAAAYRAASERFRRGEWAVDFPPRAFRPSGFAVMLS
jgi:hypothetical protein